MYEGASSSVVEFTVNISLIGGPGWIDDIIVLGGLGSLSIIIVLLIFRKPPSLWRS